MNVLDYFREISAIPRESRNEQAISNYVVNFANAHGFEVRQDDLFNVVIKKPAAIGYETAPTIILQAHLDMVCVKTNDSAHDFIKDGIEIVTDGEFIRAKDTSLGADNGIGVAVALAILDSCDEHPALEVVLTAAEEIGLVGAESLDKNDLNGQVFINLDGFGSNELCVGSAGAMRLNIDMSIEHETVPSNHSVYELKVCGLLSGHSGDEIHKERANAIVLATRAVCKLQKLDAKLVDVCGGTKFNLIPNICTMKFAFPNDKITAAQNLISILERELQNEFKQTEPGLSLSLQKVDEHIDEIISLRSQQNILHAIMLIPIGVINMSMEIDNLPNTSNNLGVIETNDNSIVFSIMIRSMTSSRKYHVADKIKLLFDLFDCKVDVVTDVPAWDYKKESALNTKLIKIYNEMFGEEPNIVAIHGGLECNCFADRVNELVSLGADVFELHTVNEHCRISSIDKLYNFLKAILKSYGVS